MRTFLNAPLNSSTFDSLSDGRSVLCCDFSVRYGHNIFKRRVLTRTPEPGSRVGPVGRTHFGNGVPLGVVLALPAGCGELDPFAFLPPDGMPLDGSIVGVIISYLEVPG